MSDALKDVTFEGYDLASGRRVTELHLSDGTRLDEGVTLAVPGDLAADVEDHDHVKIAQHKKETPRATRLPRGAGEPQPELVGGGPAGTGPGAGSTGENAATGD